MDLALILNQSPSPLEQLSAPTLSPLEQSAAPTPSPLEQSSTARSRGIPMSDISWRQLTTYSHGNKATEQQITEKKGSNEAACKELELQWCLIGQKNVAQAIANRWDPTLKTDSYRLTRFRRVLQSQTMRKSEAQPVSDIITPCRMEKKSRAMSTGPRSAHV